MMQPGRVPTLLSMIYGAERAPDIQQQLTGIMDRFRGRIPAPRRSGLSEQDAILITYADQVQQSGTPTFVTLTDFCNQLLDGLLSGIHILPFFPWSSDDGFSVVDYEAVAQQFGTWADVRHLGEHFRLMFDAVLNHASAESHWFQSFLQGDSDFRDFFIEVRGSPDLSAVVRPRALPLLAEFQGAFGPMKLWTTFSTDQVDLNYHNPQVLLRMIEVVLFYASQGAEFLRLDAIAYLWKEPGTPCINLPHTHWIVQLLRAVLDEVAPHVMLITETNVPNRENLSYFGDGSNEAQMVYNFSLPPLVLHAMQTGSASALSDWAAGLRLPSSRATFLNFLASHDGIGLNPARGILPESEIEAMAGRIQAAGGFISNKSNPDGTQSPYEMNVNYFDALNAAGAGDDLSTQVDRFITAHAILLAFMGVPAIYFHSLFGSRGWPEGVQRTQKYRTINREKLQRDVLEQELAEPSSLRSRIFTRLARLLKIRSSHSCFAPEASQQIVNSHGGIFALVRQARSGSSIALCLHNVTRTSQRAEFDLSDVALSSSLALQDVITGRQFATGDHLNIVLRPYETLWLMNIP